MSFISEDSGGPASAGLLLLGALFPERRRFFDSLALAHLLTGEECPSVWLAALFLSCLDDGGWFAVEDAADDDEETEEQSPIAPALSFK